MGGKDKSADALFPGNEKTYGEGRRVNRALGTAPCSFGITLSDGSAVRVEFDYVGIDIPRFNFCGKAVSGTGYRSCFPIEERVQSREELEELALAYAEHWRTVTLKQAGKAKKTRGEK
jgi:hypothetical protein